MRDDTRLPVDEVSAAMLLSLLPPAMVADCCSGNEDGRDPYVMCKEEKRGTLYRESHLASSIEREGICDSQNDLVKGALLRRLFVYMIFVCVIQLIQRYSTNCRKLNDFIVSIVCLQFLVN